MPLDRADNAIASDARVLAKAVLAVVPLMRRDRSRDTIVGAITTWRGLHTA
jgi:hypothetical protein